jgi:hypothetical protein
MREDTRRFLELMNQQNEKIAAMQTNESESVGTDAVRLERDEARREKFGQLRAREHPTRQPSRVKRVYN